MSQTRQLAAIMFTDIVGYTALMGKDEKQAYEVLRQNRRIHIQVIDANRGKLIKELGDGILSSFNTATDAIQAALDIQNASKTIEYLTLRIGIHEGEILFENNDVFGDVVNIASRIQTLGVPGSVLISKKVHDEIENKSEFKTLSLGNFEFKNVNKPIEIFALTNEGLTIPRKNKIEGKLKKKGMPSWVFIAGILGLLIAGYWLYSILKKKSIPVDESKSIAVLPFDNMSGDADQEYFSDGIAEEIINSLAQVNNLKVVGRTSSFQFKGKNPDLKEVGIKLGVNTILEGSVRRQGDSMRITVQLIDLRDGYHLWSERFDRNLSDAFAVQDEIARTVTNKLRITLLENNTTPGNKYVPKQEAYDLYLKGRYFWNKRGKDLFTGLRYFEQAIAADSLFALAYSGVAESYIVMGGFYETSPPGEAMPRAQQAAEKAIQLDKNCAEAYAVLGYQHLMYRWDWDKSEQYYKKSIALNSNYAPAHNWYSLFLQIIRKDNQNALLEAQKAVDLEPLNANQFGNYSRILVLQNNYTKALEVTDKGLELNQNLYVLIYMKGRILISLKKYADAIAVTHKGMDIIGRVPVLLGNLGIAYSLLGKVKEAEAIFSELINRSKTEYISPYALARLAQVLNRKEEAIGFFNQAITERSSRLIYAGTDFDFKSLENDPDYHFVLDTLHLPR